MTQIGKEDVAIELFRIVRNEIRVGTDFTPVSNLQQNGLDSLALTRLLLAVEERLGIWIDESFLTPENLENVETLAACVYERLQDR